MKRGISWILFLILLFGSIPAVQSEEGIWASGRTEAFSAELVQMPSAKARAEGFISLIMKGIGLEDNAVRDLGGRLTGSEKKLYGVVSKKIVQVAAGNLASTSFDLVPGDVFVKTTYTAQELGLTSLIEGGQISQEAISKFLKATAINTNLVGKSLLADYPYELYWFDKTASGGWAATYEFTCDGISIGYSKYSFSMAVAKEYQDGDQFKMKTAYGQSAQAAAQNAKNIVAKHKGESDRLKLSSYLKEICDLVSYNTAAAQGGTSYGNPWQLVWVFDGNTNTNVVCEGYAKAFQYLSDNTAFSGNISTICATGTMSGGTGAGPHMWNLVRMPDGKNYMVDVTNCDTGTVGAPNALFLCGYSSGSAANGYVYKANGTNVTYVYDKDFTNLVRADELEMSEKEYTEGSTQPPTTTTPPPTVTTPPAVTTPPTRTTPPPASTTPPPKSTTPPPTTTTPPPTTVTPPTTPPTVMPPETTPPTEKTYTWKDPKGTGVYLITGKTAVYKAPLKSKAAITIPASITINGKKILVTEIGKKAFSNQKWLKTVNIGSNVKIIGEKAFAGCVNLKTVKGGKAVTEIGASAFEKATALASFPVMSKLQEIGSSAFANCKKLTAFTFGKEVTTIGKKAFSKCTGLRAIKVLTVKLKKGSLGKDAFKGIYKKAAFHFPKKKRTEYTDLFKKAGAPKTAIYK